MGEGGGFGRVWLESGRVRRVGEERVVGVEV